MGLTPIVNGTLADATVVDNNFKYLKNELTSVSSSVTNMKTDIKSYTNSVLSIYQDINTLNSSGDIELSDNSVNYIRPTGNVNFVLPTISDNKLHQIYVIFNVDSHTLYAWVYDTYTIYTKTLVISSNTKLYNADSSIYTGTDFIVYNDETNNTYQIKYQGNLTTYTQASDISIAYDFNTYNIELGTDWTLNNATPQITEQGKYNIIYEYDTENWVCGITKRVEVS